MLVKNEEMAKFTKSKYLKSKDKFITYIFAFAKNKYQD